VHLRPDRRVSRSNHSRSPWYYTNPAQQLPIFAVSDLILLPESAAHVGTCCIAQNKCYQQDSATHNTLCSTFYNFRNSERPTSNHYRAILFPVNNFKPRFIWLRVNGARGYQIFDSNNLARYIPGLRDDAFAISRYADLDREYENTMFLMHHLDLEGSNEQLVN
jgi:hypothetical protein